MDAFLCLTPRNRPVPKELLENSSRRVDETVLAPATSHNLYITSPTDETVPAIVEKQQPPILSHVEEAVPFSSSKHESGALGHIGEVIPIPFGVRQHDILRHDDKMGPNHSWMQNLDTLNHLDARLDALVIELESKASSMSKETPRDLATRRDSTNTSGCKSESQVATPSFGSGSTTRGSFRPDHGSSSGVSKVMAVIWEQDQERQERQEQEERMGRQEWRKQNQEQRSVVPKPALKSVVQPGAAGLPAKVQFRPGQTQPEAREENQEQRPASRPGAVQLPANVLFPDYNKDDSMILNLTKSETGFNIRTSNGSPVFKVTGMRASSLDLNDTVLSMAGRHFLTFREQGTLLRTTFSGEDANGREIFKIKCPVTCKSPLHDYVSII